MGIRSPWRFPPKRRQPTPLEDLYRPDAPPEDPGHLLQGEVAEEPEGEGDILLIRPERDGLRARAHPTRPARRLHRLKNAYRKSAESPHSSDRDRAGPLEAIAFLEKELRQAQVQKIWHFKKLSHRRLPF